MLVERPPQNRPDHIPPVYFDSHGGAFFVRSYLGKGGFAECLQVEDGKGRSYALKVVNRSRLVKASQMDKMLREISIHRALSHPHIVRLIHTFSDENAYHLLLELCNSSTLLQYLSSTPRGFLSENEGSDYFFQLLLAVDYLHSKGILHRDLKPGNVLMTAMKQIKLADFGLAITMHELHERGNTSVSGTPNYLAPEVLDRRGHSVASECWALGCTLFCMLTGFPPFETSSLDQTYERIRRGAFNVPDYVTLSWSTMDLLYGLLNVDPDVRTSVKEAIRSGFMRQFSSNLDLDENGNFARVSRVGSSEFQARESGAVSCDSGVGSEPSLVYANSPDLQRVASFVNLVLWCLRGLLNSSLSLITNGVSENMAQKKIPTFVAMWVDYSNKYGFGYGLNNGSFGVLFNDSRSIVIQPSSTGPRRVTIASQVMLGTCPEVFYEYEGAHARSRYDKEIRVADMCMEYMSRELLGDCQLETVMPLHSPYLVHRRKDVNKMLMVLSNETLQLNFLNEHMKFIFTKVPAAEEGTRGAYLKITVLDPDHVARDWYVMGAGRNDPGFPEHLLLSSFFSLTLEQDHFSGSRTRGPTAC